MSKKKLHTFVGFLDYSKAFNKVNRTKIFYRLIECLPAHHWLALKRYYDQSNIVIENKGKINNNKIKMNSTIFLNHKKLKI